MVRYIVFLAMLALRETVGQHACMDGTVECPAKDALDTQSLLQAKVNVTQNLDVAKATAPSISAETRPESIHFLYNTGCDEYQLMQAIVVDHSWRTAGNRGRLTRIVTGCKPEDPFRDKMLQSPLKDDPEYAVWFLEGDYGTIPGTGKSYGARARPISIEQWLNDVKPSESLLAILEPDHVCMFPLSEHPGIGRVRPGRILAQEYAYGDQWWKKFAEVGENMQHPGFWVVQQKYTTGPPWVIHVDDVRKMLPEWKQYGDDMKPMDPELYREQFAFMMAAAKHDIQNEPNVDGTHRMRNNPLMVSNPIDWPIESWDVEPDDPAKWKPIVIHYCITYEYKSWNFHKSLPSDGFKYMGSWSFQNRVPTINKCGAPFFQEPSALPPISEEPNMKNQRQMYVLKHLITRYNKAMAAYRRIYCPDEAPKLVSEPPDAFGFMRVMQPRTCPSMGSGPQTRYRVRNATGDWDFALPLGGDACSEEAQAAECSKIRC